MRRRQGYVLGRRVPLGRVHFAASVDATFGGSRYDVRRKRWGTQRMARATRQATAPRAGQVVLLLDAVGVPREHVGRTGVIADVRPSASVVVVVDGDSGARESVDVPAGAFLTAETLLYNDKGRLGHVPGVQRPPEPRSDCLSPMRPPPGLLHKQDDRNNGTVRLLPAIGPHVEHVRRESGRRGGRGPVMLGRVCCRVHRP